MQGDVPGEVVGREAHHESAGIGPGLRGKVADVGDAQACLFPDLAPDALFERLACLDEARHESVVTVAEGVGVHHENLVATLYADDDSGGEAGPKLLAALAALLADFRLPLHLSAADTAELVVLMEVDQFGALACELIVFRRKDVERLPERHHLQVGAVGNGGREGGDKSRTPSNSWTPSNSPFRGRTHSR